MRLEKIIIEDYKSIKYLEWNLNDRLTCLVGQNESGKSNILDVFDFYEIENMELLNYQKHTRRASDKYTSQVIPYIQFFYSIKNESFNNFIKSNGHTISEDSKTLMNPDCVIFETKNQLNTSENYKTFK